MRGPLFYELAGCIVCLVFELMSIEQSIHEHKFGAAIILSVVTLGGYITMLYVICFYADNLSSRSAEVAGIMSGDLMWYKLTIQQQKMMCIIIRRAQKNFTLNGYGIFDCSMEVFLNVIMTIFFMKLCI